MYEARRSAQSGAASHALRSCVGGVLQPEPRWADADPLAEHARKVTRILKAGIESRRDDRAPRVAQVLLRAIDAPQEDKLVRRELLFFLGENAAQTQTNFDQAKELDGLRERVDRAYLLRLYAEARLLAGCPDPEAAVRLLPAAEAERLRDRVDVELLPHNARQVAADAAVELKLALKNVEKLSVRIHKVDLAAYYRATGEELDPSVEVTVVVADAYPNFSICGIPYYFSREVQPWQSLAHRTHADLEATGMNLRLDTRATAIDVDGRRLTVRDASGWQTRRSPHARRSWSSLRRSGVRSCCSRARPSTR